MTDVVAYARTVKNIEKKSVVSLLSVVDVGAKNIIDNINILEANGITLESEGRSWAVLKSINNAISRALPYSADTPPLTLLSTVSEVIVSLHEKLLKNINHYSDSIWSGVDLTVKQTYLLSTIEQLDYWIKYANKLLDCLLTMSTETNFRIDKYLTKNEMLFLNGSSTLFANISISLLKGSTLLIKELESIPELAADDEVSAAVLEGLGDKRPELHRGFGLHAINPKYWYDSLMKDINLWRIRELQDNNEYLSMKISQAINLKNGTEDAALDFRIEKYRGKIIKNSATISGIVESYQ